MMPFRSVASFIFVLVLQACTTSPNPFSLPRDIESEFNPGPEEAAFIRQNPKLAHRTGKRLTLVFPDGKISEFEDKGGAKCDSMPEGEIGDCYIRHRAIGYWPLKQTFLLNLSFYEGSAALLVHRDEELIPIVGIPIFSSDLSRFFVYSTDCGHYASSDIEVWDWLGKYPERKYENTVEACITSAEWISNTKVRIDFFDTDAVPDDEKRPWIGAAEKDQNGLWALSGTESPQLMKVRQ